MNYPIMFLDRGKKVKSALAKINFSIKSGIALTAILKNQIWRI